jgi:hypothetical protein
MAVDAHFALASAAQNQLIGEATKRKQHANVQSFMSKEICLIKPSILDNLNINFAVHYHFKVFGLINF